MVHPLTRAAASTAFDSIGVPMEIGLVFPPRPGEARGRGVWPGHGHSVEELDAMLPRFARANAAGAAIYMRLAPVERDAHPGLLLLDDLSADHVMNLNEHGFTPRVLIETSPGNLQAWISLLPERRVILHEVALAAARSMAATFDADPRAVATRQPGRLPGFTNRKDRHRRPDGHYPFVRLISAHPRVVAPAGADLIASIIERRSPATQGRRGAPERKASLRLQADHLVDDIHLDELHALASARIKNEFENGLRPSHRASQSEADFAFASAALRAGLVAESIADWLSSARPEKASDYSIRTGRGCRKVCLYRVNGNRAAVERT